MQERRTLTRFHLDAPASFLAEIPGREREMILLAIRDISAHGAFLLTDASIPPGTTGRLDIYLDIDDLEHLTGDGQTRISVTGEVIRSEDGGFALLFAKGSFQVGLTH